MLFPKFSFFIIALVFTALFSCSTKIHNKDEVDMAMKKYDRLIQEMNTDSIALLYTEDGDLGNLVHGRDSIRKFLNSFQGFKVLSQSSTTESINISVDTALQKGTYHQVAVTPKNDTLT